MCVGDSECRSANVPTERKRGDRSKDRKSFSLTFWVQKKEKETKKMVCTKPRYV